MDIEDKWGNPASAKTGIKTTKRHKRVSVEYPWKILSCMIDLLDHGAAQNGNLRQDSIHSKIC